MSIKNTTTLKDLDSVESTDVAMIVREVRQHGFYSAHCASLVLNAQNPDDLIARIQLMAASAKLMVSFNAAGDLCIFEARN